MVGTGSATESNIKFGMQINHGKYQRY